jgi:hypothetical protein
LLLSIITLILDIIIFTEDKIFLSDEKEEKYSNGDTKSIDNDSSKKSSSTVSPVSTISTVSSIVYSSYRDINDIIIDELKKYKNVNNNKKILCF